MYFRQGDSQSNILNKRGSESMTLPVTRDDDSVCIGPQAHSGDELDGTL